MTVSRLFVIMMSLSLLLNGCGSEDSQKEALPDETITVSDDPAGMPKITASFDTRIEFARYLIEQANAGNLDSLLTCMAPGEMLLKLRDSKRYSKPNPQLKAQILSRAEEHYRKQIATFVAVWKNVPVDQVNFIDLAQEEYETAEAKEIARQGQLGLGDNFGDVLLVSENKECRIQAFRYKGAWYASDLAR